jgi:hypothetical protein
MKLRSVLLTATLCSLISIISSGLAHAESTMTCPTGTYDMLDWMTLDSDLRTHTHVSGTANPLYTNLGSGKFYWTKGGNGSPWDIQLLDNNYIYLWITEFAWNSPNTYKKFTYNTNMPLAPRCAKAGFPGSTIKVPNTTYDIYTDCNHHTTHALKKGINQVYGPYTFSFGGNLPNNLKSLIISYRYNCDNNYGACGDKEEYYLAQRYGLLQWVHYTLMNGKYVQQQKSVFNTLTSGSTTPKFVCF